MIANVDEKSNSILWPLKDVSAVNHDSHQEGKLNIVLLHPLPYSSDDADLPFSAHCTSGVTLLCATWRSWTLVHMLQGKWEYVEPL